MDGTTQSFYSIGRERWMGRPRGVPRARSSSICGLDLLAGSGAKRLQVAVEGASVAEDETRNEAKDRVVDFAVFGDADARAFGRSLEREGPGSAVGKASVSDAALQRERRPGIEKLIRH